MTGVPELGVLALPKHCSNSRRQTQAAWPGLQPSCAQGTAQSLPSLAHCPSHHHSTKTRRMCVGQRGLEEEHRTMGSPCSPRSVPLPGDKTAEKASEPWCYSGCQTICSHRPQGAWERCCMELGIVSGDDGICCRSGICLFSNCLLPEQGSDPERL